MPPKPRQRRKQREVSAHMEHSQAESAVNVQGQDQPQPPPSNHNQEVPPTNLLLELIQSLQQNQSELAEAIKQLKGKDAGTKTPPQNEDGDQEKPHEDSGSHQKEATFVTMSDVADLLKQEREKNPKEPRLFVRKPPYPAELLKQPYPEKYVAPTFSRFDGRKGSALVHISKFVDSMGAYAGNGDLCLREFSKSLDDRAYTWYTTLPPGSVKVWEDMVELFCGKYFQAEEKITLVNLHTTKQANGEDLLRYIHRFRDISLDCYANYEEGELVGVCIDNMLPEFRAHLENLDISRFGQLLQKARKTALSVKPHAEKPREKKNPPQVLTVSTVNSKRRKSNERSFDEAPPPPSRLCRGIPGFGLSSIKLGLNPEARTAATEAIMAIAADSGAHCFTAETHASRAFLETTNAVTFTDEDMEVQYPDHRRPLYLSATINEVQVRRALVDNGSCINLIPLSTIQAAEIPQKKIQGAPMEIKGFGGVGEYTKGHIQLVLKVGPIVAFTRFHVVDSVVPYHILLGRPWLHKHQLIPSTYHQCVKGRLNGKPIRIAANSAPFDQSESHFVEAALYDEITPAGEASLAKPIGIPLPKWEEIKDAPGADLRDLLEQKKKRKAEASTSESQPQCPSCLAVNEASAPEPADAAEPVAADSKISAEEELEVINLSSDPNVNRPVSISASLSVGERMHLVELLKEYQDVFAWQYDEMPGIDPKLVAHSLNVEPGTKPVVQPMRTFHPEVEAQITQEVKKLLSAGFIKPIQHPRWLSNIVPVKKKNGQIRCCVDFRNLNKACPKDEFPLPNMDLLIDSAAGHAMFSFMDGFSGYNQICMSPKDAEKTAFRTPIGNFYYTVMPFGLKNAGATYQRTMTAMFHDMMHREIEDYVDDIVVKSKTRRDHFGVLKKVFERCRLYKLKMNPLKCAFGVSAGKFLGFLVHQRGIDVDPTRASAIATMKPPTTHKELKSFLGKLSYIRRFIPGLAAVTSAFSPLLKKGASFRWSTECQEAFEKLKKTVMGLNNPIYYVSRTLKDAESRYSGAERSCLALIYASQRLRHYFLAHKVQLMTKSHPYQKSAASSQAIADLLAQFPGEDNSLITDEVPGEINEVFLAGLADSVWTLRFDGSSTATSAGAGIVLYKDDGEAVTKSFKFDFPCSNNAAEYEAYLAGLAIAYEMGIKHLRVIGDSNLVVCQARGEFSLKEPSLAPYRALAQKFEARFSTFEIEHAQRNENRYADALATLGSQMAFEGEEMDVTICKKAKPITESLRKEFEELSQDQEDWRAPIKAKLVSPADTADLREIKDYTLISGDLYRRLPGGVLARCISLEEAKESMSAEAAEIQNQCPTCQFHYSNEEVCATFVSADWRTPFLEYLLERILPSNPKDVYRLKRTSLELPSTLQSGWKLSLSERRRVLQSANFIREHIITRFGIPYKLITDNGTPFVNKDVREVLEHYRVKHRRSTPYYPQDVLWAYRSSPKTATGFTPFSLVYGTDTISPTELVVPSPRVMQGSELETDANMCAEARMADLEGLDEARDLAKAKAQRNYQKMASVYSKALRVRIFAEGQMVLKAAEFVRRNLPSPSKFSPNWDGPYIIREAHGSGYYRLSKPDGTTFGRSYQWKMAETLLLVRCITADFALCIFLLLKWLLKHFVLG
uniref:RNA-directed DNA polymerase n=1 Tax=Fagus sylvatica TaxID=28930 RepID=A0A2N9IS56_FAGSY